MNQFEEIESCYISSLQANYQLFEDARTGARHVHLANDDNNNAFMVALPTRPTDSTGVAHILEHTILCGSRSYPVRDPFFMMLRRSLNTFMNAFTSSDCTAYPFATQNRKDFDNLLRVYLDSVFFPILDPLDFDQEGWRLDFSEDDNGLVYKGVVYNEMKGAMSSPVAQLWQHLSAGLFPDTIYAHNSGGDPAAITDLNYADLKSFHARHYHPSHAVFMSYGSFPCEEHQRLISEQVLQHFENIAKHEALGLQSAFSEPARCRVPYAVDEQDTSRKTHALWAWTLGRTASARDFLEAQFLSSLLLYNSASPLRYLLESTELADAPSELCGIDESAQQLVFAAGVEGTDEGAVDQLEAQIREVIAEIGQKGVTPSVAEGVLDSIEMSQRDVGGNSYPFGLQLMSRMLPAFVYGNEPRELLTLDEEIEQLRQKIKDKSYVPDLVHRLLIDNSHHARIVMWPDPEKGQRDQTSEKARLNTLSGELSAASKQALKARIEALGERQHREENASVLPKVSLADVPLELGKISGRSEFNRGTEFSFYERPTNGLFYANLVFELNTLTAEELSLLPFFTEFLLELGSGGDTFATVQERRAQLGHFSAYSSARNLTTDIDTVSGRLVLTGKCLARKSTSALSELATILPGLRVDELPRIKDLIVQERTDAEASVVDRGHLIAMIGAATGLTPSATLDDCWQGPESILRTQALEHGIIESGQFSRLTDAFASIRDKLFTQACRVLFVGEAGVLEEVSGVAKDLQFHDAAQDRDPAVSALNALPANNAASAWTAASQINFCARAHRAAAPGDDAVAGLMVLSKYLQDGYLHPAIRETGGAYGSGAQYDAESSTFRFFSYRDPRLSETFADFERSLDWLAENRQADRLEESILGVIRQLDKPKSPAGAAISAYYDELDGVGFDYQKNLRERVLGTTYSDVLRAAERFLRDTPALSAVSDRSKQAELEELGLQAKKLA